MSLEADQAQLAAGGYVPASAKLGKGDVVDVVVARAYRHAVLPGRAVVRLVAEGVAAGDELEMATLGFGAGEDRGAVAKERKRALGFPGWALVNDPKNARYALDVVKEFKKVARRAKSKPGAAKEGVDKIAATLGKTVPHFLPSFFEEAGRVFLEHGAASYAAIYFGKAREAEAVHALAVDEQQRVDAFLEFALAGAVTTKALAQYAKDLAEHQAPADAYAHFRKLCVQRTLGGMPPWAGMAKELQRLAKAAKLDVAAEDRAVVAEIIASPALAKAAGEFWRAYDAPIRELATASPAVRGALLNLFPTGSGVDDIWLDLLDATGASAALVGDAPSEARPTTSRAAWFDKLTTHLARDWRDNVLGTRAFALLRRMAPALIADGAPIRCAGRNGVVDLDLCELALELGVPVAAVVDDKRAWASARFQLVPWSQAADQPEHGRDPVHVAPHPVFGPLLVKAVAETIGNAGFEVASAGKAGFLAAKRAWLEGLLARAEDGGLPVVMESLSLIEQKARASLFAELPDLHARLAALDVAPALQRSLQIGMLDELGWPALEEACAQLSPDRTPLMITGGAPAVICASKTTLVAVGATGRLGEHDLVLPPKHELLSARFIGGQFLVILKEGYAVKAYWSSAPSDVFAVPEASTWQFEQNTLRAAVTPDGGWLESGKAIYPGDRTVPFARELRAYDGTTAWIVDPSEATRWREVSPATGEKGRQSWPAPIERVIEDDWKVDANESWLLPAPHGGLEGVAALYRYDETAKVMERLLVDLATGARWHKATPIIVSGLLALPGASEPRVLSAHTAWRDSTQTTIWDPELATRGSVVSWRDRGYSRATAAPLAHVYWSQFSVRDAAGSQRLRATTLDQARALIAAIPVDANGDIPSGVPDELIAEALPGVTSQQVRNGITGFAIVAVKAQQLRDRLARDRAPGAAAAPATATIADPVLRQAIVSWVDRAYTDQGSAWQQIAEIGAWFASADRSNRYLHTVPATLIPWFDLALMPSALAFAALAIGTPAESRRHAAQLFAHLVRSLPPADTLRTYDVTGAHGFPGGSHNGCDVRWYGGNAYAVRKIGYTERYQVLEYAPSGAFAPPPTGALSGEVRGVAPGLPAEALGELEAAIAAGRTSWSVACAERIAAATGLAPSAAAFLWAGMPGVHEREQNFLAKELREELGLKAAQAVLGRDTIRVLDATKRMAAFDEAARAGVAALLDGSAADVFAQAWIARFGRRVAVPEALIAAADDELQTQGQPAHWLAAFAMPDEAPQLVGDATCGVDPTGTLIRVANREPLVGQTAIPDAAPAFDMMTLGAAMQYLPFLFAELPVGDPLRAAVPRVHELVLARLANPGLWFDGGARYLTNENRATFERLLDGVGGQPVAGLAGELRGVVVPGALLLVDKNRAMFRLQPARLDATTAPRVHAIANTLEVHGATAIDAVLYARSPGLAQMMARIRDTPVPAGGWEQNPLASAPALVARVAKALGVSAEAAALYLQYLVLLWPTPKQLAVWNGWKPKQLAAAQDELVGKELIVEAKRERAQRTHFLPGGWEALKSPHPPLETWKAAMYAVRDPHGNLRPPRGRFLALAPFHAMFEAAWERIASGDVPRYEEVTR